MSTPGSALAGLSRLDELARAATPVHRLDPRAKVLATLVYLVCVASFDRYEVLGLLPFVFYPVALAAAGGLPAGLLARRLAVVAPFALIVGAFNPLLDREVVAHVGPLAVTAGWVSYASIVLRFLLTAGVALVLVGVTGFTGVCLALSRLGLPRVFVTQLLLLYRYLFVLAGEGQRMARARALRAQGRRGMGWRTYASLVGHLLLRAVARAQRIYQAMACRGFSGEVVPRQRLRFTGRDAVFLASWSAAFLAFRLVDVVPLLGRLVTGGLA